MEKPEKKNPLPEEIRGNIKNRESWFKIIAGLIFLGLICYKIAVSDLNFDFSKFDFSDLLSLSLAIFSIGLSVAFYFKATDTSNKFYDNTYKFTKDISEILGRIEAGFGERLKHLDEGYTGLRDKFDGSSTSNNNEEIKEAKKELEQERGQLQKEVQEKNELLEELMTKAQLGEEERQDFTQKINQREEQIEKLSSELRFLNRRLRNAERSRENEMIHSIDNLMRAQLTKYISNEIDIDMLLDAPIDLLMRRIRFDPTKHPESLTFPLKRMGFLDDEMRFTPAGIELLRSIARRI
jgi:Skp family chaperone for outer membrane proteins